MFQNDYNKNDIWLDCCNCSVQHYSTHMITRLLFQRFIIMFLVLLVLGSNIIPRPGLMHPLLKMLVVVVTVHDLIKRCVLVISHMLSQ